MILEALLADLESDRAERTISLNDASKFGEAICAFANDLPGHRLPGYLFVGANPDGSASGAQITDKLLQNLAAIRSDGNIQPLPAMNVQKWPLGGSEMAVIEVLPSDLPPVRYKGRTWVRVGPRRAVAGEQEERLLGEKRIASARTWDARPCVGAALDDLSLDLFRLSYLPNAVSAEVLAHNHREIGEQLASLRLYDLKKNSPTNAGVLLFAKDPLFYVPGAYVQFVEYEGPALTNDVVRERRFSGDLLQVMRGLDELCQDLADARPIATPGLAERTVYAFPPRALHELLMNAVIHRNYEGSTSPVMVNLHSDRIEILNPGGLFGDLTKEMFPKGTAYRNPIIAEAAKTLGFVNRFGRGIAVAQEELARNQSIAAEFEIQSNHVLVSVRRRS